MNAPLGDPKIRVENLTIFFGKARALNNLSLDIHKNEILSVIGPANSGKTSFLRALNRLNVFEPHLRMSGSIRLDGRDICRDIEAEDLRKKSRDDLRSSDPSSSLDLRQRHVRSAAGGDGR